MKGFSLFKTVSYHKQSIKTQVQFAQPVCRNDLAQQSFDKQRELEKSLDNFLKKSMSQSQRTDPTVTANAIGVSEVLATICSEKSGKKIILTINKQDVVALASQESDGFTRNLFAAVYLSNSELLSPYFNHVTSLDLNSLKDKLLAKLFEFKKQVLECRDHIFNRCLVSNTQLVSCQQVFQCFISLIQSAKSISAVLASVIVEADVFAQMGVMQNNSYPKENTSLSSLFAHTLPQILSNSIEEMSLGATLNTTGSAFQLEWARESFITQVRAYLHQRARLDRLSVSQNNVTCTYTPINLGFSANIALQEARIQIASNLLMQLDFLQLELLPGELEPYHAGAAITNPQFMAEALINAINKNHSVQLAYGRSMDGKGELDTLLYSMLLELKNIYPQYVKCTEYTHNLNVQLSFEEPLQARCSI